MSSVTKFEPYQRRRLARSGEPPHDDSMDERVAKLEEHCSQLRVDVGVMKERQSHMPTNADLLRVVSSAQWKIIGAIALFAILAALKWAWPILFR